MPEKAIARTDLIATCLEVRGWTKDGVVRCGRTVDLLLQVVAGEAACVVFGGDGGVKVEERVEETMTRSTTVGGRDRINSVNSGWCGQIHHKHKLTANQRTNQLLLHHFEEIFP